MTLGRCLQDRAHPRGGRCWLCVASLQVSWGVGRANSRGFAGISAFGHGDVLAQGGPALEGPHGHRTPCALPLLPCIGSGRVWRGQHGLGAPWGKENSWHPQGKGRAGGEGESLGRLRGALQKGSGCELRGAGAVPEGSLWLVRGETQHWVLVAVGETTTHNPWTAGRTPLGARGPKFPITKAGRVEIKRAGIPGWAQPCSSPVSRWHWRGWS